MVLMQRKPLVGVGAMQELVKMPSHSSSITMVDVGACAATAFGIPLWLPQPWLRLRK